MKKTTNHGVVIERKFYSSYLDSKNSGESLGVYFPHMYYMEKDSEGDWHGTQFDTKERFYFFTSYLRGKDSMYVWLYEGEL